jgi:hypothetical protein
MKRLVNEKEWTKNFKSTRRRRVSGIVRGRIHSQPHFTVWQMIIEPWFTENAECIPSMYQAKRKINEKYKKSGIHNEKIREQVRNKLEGKCLET